MHYAKVQFYSPTRKRLKEINPDVDRLHGEIWDDDQMLARADATLDEELLSRCSERDIRALWVEEPRYEWRQMRDDTLLQGTVVEEREVSPVRHQLLRALPSIESPAALETLISEYERADVSEMVYSKLVTARQLLSDLMEREEKLVDQLKEADEDLGPLIDELNSRNPSLDPAEYSNEGLVQELSDFVHDMRELRADIADIILQADEEATPDAAVIKNQHRSVYQALAENENSLVQSTQLAYELLRNRQKGSWESARTFLRNLHELLQRLVFDGTVNSQAFQEAVETLKNHNHPCTYWLMPENTTEMYNIFEDAIGRFVLYEHLFPDDFHDDPKTLGFVLLGCDLGMLNVPEANWLHEDELRPRQRDAVEKHARKSIELFSEVGLIDEPMTELIRGHHAPDTVSDPRAKRVALCDQYISLTADRGWRDAYRPKQALDNIDSSLPVEPLQKKVTAHPPATLAVRQDEVFFVRRIEDGVRWHGDVLKQQDGDFSFVRRCTIQDPPSSYPGHRVVPWSFRQRMIE